MKAPNFSTEITVVKRTMSTDSSGIEDPKEQSTSNLLKWISDVTIKRRQIRRKTHCSNLLAEATLSNALKKAKTELARKQEEKRRRLQMYSYQFTIQCSNLTSDNDCNFSWKNSYVNENDFQLEKSSHSFKSEGDDDVKACLSSLDSFFNELKTVKS
jgi:hypothetical protein